MAFALHELNVAQRGCYRRPMTISAPLPARAEPSPGTPADPRGLPPWLGPTRDWRWLVLYLGVPLGIGLQAALNNWAILQTAGYDTTLLFYAGHSLVPWWTSALMTWVTFRALRPWQPPQVVVLVLGGTLACLAVLPYAQWLTGLFAVGWVAGDTDGQKATSHIFGQMGIWSFMARAVATWTLANVVFDRWLGLPRYRYGRDAGTATLAPPPGPAAAVADPQADGRPASQRLLQRLPAGITAEQVLAIKAEQHYVKVHTATRAFMTLYRFSDAIAEMDPVAGSQVHRSWWVRTDAIRRVRRDGRKYLLELSTGLVVPISASNRGVVADLARRADVPMPPAN